MRQHITDVETVPDNEDELRIPLAEWTDPAAPDGVAEDNVVRSID
jgi:hypothetical protein